MPILSIETLSPASAVSALNSNTETTNIKKTGLLSCLTNALNSCQTRWRDNIKAAKQQDIKDKELQTITVDNLYAHEHEILLLPESKSLSKGTIAPITDVILKVSTGALLIGVGYLFYSYLNAVTGETPTALSLAEGTTTSTPDPFSTFIFDYIAEKSNDADTGYPKLTAENFPEYTFDYDAEVIYKVS